MSDSNTLKNELHNYWNAESCGTYAATSEKYSISYYNEIEAHRYNVEPEIKTFAEFEKYKGQKILEVGIGAGTDFSQWCKNEALAYGIDLTEEGVNHVKTRLELFNLTAQEIRVADAENIPYSDNTFDVVYSWGVIHHSPNTEKALKELVRVCKPNGEIKFMVYHLDSVNTWFFWVKHCLLKGKLFKDRAWALWNHMESIGTKAYTHKTMQDMLDKNPLEKVIIESPFCFYDDMSRFGFLGKIANSVNQLFFDKNKNGWFLKIKAIKKQ